MAAGVFAEGGSHLERTLARAAGRNVTAKCHYFPVLVADLPPAFCDFFDAAGFKIFREQDVRITLNAGVSRIFCREP